MNLKVDTYVERSTKWPDEIRALRPVLLDCGLTEELKWGKPCYCYEGANILIIQEMKAFLALMFFKGALLSDPHHVLQQQGPNSRSARRIQVTSVSEVDRLADLIEAYIKEALRVEAEGLRPDAPPKLALVEEFQQRLAKNHHLEAAFEALTPGRQREYNLHFAAAKRSATRLARIDNCSAKIMLGKGFRD